MTNLPVIHFRHCERSAAIHGCAFGAMDRHGLRPRDDEGVLVISTSLSGGQVERRRVQTIEDLGMGVAVLESRELG